MVGKVFLNFRHVTARKPIGLPKFRWPARAVQYENRLALCTDDMHMGGAVVIRIDHDPQAIEAKNGWHGETISKTQALGNIVVQS